MNTTQVMLYCGDSGIHLHVGCMCDPKWHTGEVVDEFISAKLVDYTTDYALHVTFEHGGKEYYEESNFVRIPRHATVKLEPDGRVFLTY